MTRSTFHADTRPQTLLVEQALLLARQLEQAADAAPDGKVLSAAEGVAVPAARELARRAVEPALQQQSEGTEKRGHRAAPARAAGSRRGRSGGRPGTS